MPMTQSSKTVSTAQALRRWLASGAVQAPSGAYYAWRDEAGRPSFEYPEITGYALTHFAGLDDLTEEEEEAGRQAAQWLLSRLRAGDLSARGAWDGQAVYTFDLAMIATGLMAFGLRDSSDEMMTTGAALAAAMAAEIAATGSLQSIPSSTHTTSSRSAWSTDGLAHLVKTVQCLLWAAELGDEACRDGAATLIEDSSRVQREDGRFLTHPSDQETMLHPHFYAVEGLLMFAMATGDSSALHRARLAAEWAWSYQRPSGAFPRWVASSTSEQGPDQGDLTAQALRAAVLLDVAGDRRDATAEWLAASVVWNDGGTAALPYQPGSRTVHQNTWSTLFAAQALMTYAEGPDLVSWRSLV